MSDDVADITVNDIEREVWCGSKHPDAAHAFIARELCRVAFEITHECGSRDASLRACANTVCDFLRYESSTRARRAERDLARERRRVRQLRRATLAFGALRIFERIPKARSIFDVPWKVYTMRIRAKDRSHDNA